MLKKIIKKALAPIPKEAPIRKLSTSAGKLVRRIKTDFGHFKAGRKAEADAERADLIKTNKLRMKNIREGNPEENLKLDKYK